MILLSKMARLYRHLQFNHPPQTATTVIGLVASCDLPGSWSGTFMFADKTASSTSKHTTVEKWVETDAHSVGVAAVTSSLPSPWLEVNKEIHSQASWTLKMSVWFCCFPLHLMLVDTNNRSGMKWCLVYLVYSQNALYRYSLLWETTSSLFSATGRIDLPVTVKGTNMQRKLTRDTTGWLKWKCERVQKLTCEATRWKRSRKPTGTDCHSGGWQVVFVTVWVKEKHWSVCAGCTSLWI